jgi:hypothetical protein
MTGKNALLTAACAALISGFGLGASPAGAQAAAIQSQEINVPDFVADLIEAKRSDGVLSVRVRLKNAGRKEQALHFNLSRFADKFYVQAESKKYFVLHDTEKVPLGDPTDYAHVKPGASHTFWAKYPAPPANIKKFSFNWPLGAPFDDVPITDK